jgi:cytochrome c peroxidase
MPRVKIALLGTAFAGSIIALSCVAFSDSLPPDSIYRPLTTQPFSVVRAADEAAKPEVMRRQAEVLQARYDLSNRPIPDVFMSGKRKAVQGGARVKLPQGVTWDMLAQMTPDAMAEGDLLPAGFMPLPHVKQSQGGQVFPNILIDTIRDREARVCGASMSISICPTISRLSSRRRFISPRILNWATYPREACSRSRITTH